MSEYITIPTSKGDVLVDEDVFKTLKRLNKKSRIKRKLPIPLRVTATGHVQWGGRFEGKQQTIYLHHLTIGRPIFGLVVDHINRNPLDNRRCNLRVVTYRTNNINKVKSSKYYGTSFDKEWNKWIAQIAENGKTIKLGRFNCRIMAKAVYEMARELIENYSISD